MKTINTSLWLFLLILETSCNSKSSNSDVGQQQKSLDSSFINKYSDNNIHITFQGFNTTDLGFGWYYYDNFNQQTKIYPNNEKISLNWSNENLLMYYTIPQTIYCPVTSGDSIIIRKNTSSPYYPILEMPDNRFSAFELNFPAFLSEKNSSIFEYGSRKIPNQLYPLNGNAKQYYDRAVLLTDSCVKVGAIHSKYEQWIRKILKYSYYSEAIWQKEIPDLVISSTLSKEPTDLDNALYRKLLHDYFTNVDLKRKNDFKKGYTIAKENYSGDKRDFLLLKSVLQIAKGSEADKKKYIILFNKDCQSVDYKKYIEQNYTSVLSNQLSKKDRIINVNKNIFSLDSLLSSFKGNIVYIDVWASWCAPCRAEMPHSTALKQQFADKNIKFVYISIDDNYSNWLKANTDEKLDVNSYLLTNSKESLFTNRYKILTIPRYLLIDKDGKVIDSDAPRPADLKLIELINKNI
jgi:thiol-disulfide isomerase/thioredoxin